MAERGDQGEDDRIARDLDLAVRLGAELPLPGAGRTRERWDTMAAVAADDVTTARVVEPHVDALAILAEAAAAGIRTQAPADATWGVFAAEAPDARLAATPPDRPGEPWRLDGRKPWCSLAGRLSHALVTAHTPDGRRLFAVDLRHPGVTVVPGAWHAVGLAEVPSGPVDLAAVPAEPVGDAGWYLRRPGFAHGGIGVAACWFGGATTVAGALVRSATEREPDQIALLHLGSAELLLSGARLQLDDAARRVDAGTAVGRAGELLALRVRTAVAQAAENVLTIAGHALGPAPLTQDDEHARRVADLTVYLRQHHAERDLARLGAAVVGSPPW